MTRRTGIFGGSFNPVHCGHIALAQQLRRMAALDEVWLMLSPQNPLKPSASLLPDVQRLELLRAAVRGHRGLVASDYELHLPRPSYTWNTLQRLQTDYPDRQFTLLIGADNWAIFPRWYHAQDILQHFSVVVYPRRGSHVDAAQLPQGVTMVSAQLLDVSSTDIRQRVQQGLSIDGLVPPAIARRVQRYYAEGPAESPSSR